MIGDHCVLEMIFFYFQINRHKWLEEIRVSTSCLKHRKAIRGDMWSEGESG